MRMPSDSQEEPAVQLHAAFGPHVDLGHPAADAVRIELVVPRRVEPVGEVDALAVAADLDHLRAAVQRLSGLARVRRAADDAAEPDRADLLRLERVADVVLDELARAPARHVEIPVVEREVDVGHERRHGLESLQERRQLLRIGGLRGNLDDLLDRPLAVRAVRRRPRRYHSQIDDERSLSDTTTPTKP